jgi:hypothetical protein
MSSHKFSVQAFEYDDDDVVMENIRKTGIFTESMQGSKAGHQSIATSTNSGLSGLKGSVQTNRTSSFKKKFLSSRTSSQQGTDGSTYSKVR